MTLNKDQIGALIFLLLSITYGYYSTHIDLLPGDEYEPFHARSLPTALAFLGGLLAFILLISSSMNKDNSQPGLSLKGLDIALTGQLLILITLFAVLLPWVGFLLSTIAFLTGGYWLLGERRPRTLFLASVPFATCIWFTLTQLLDIYLAPGQLFTMIAGS
ncbi:hypothetical protein ACH42_11280 [Endozoicomonas sp. (ex Bugula neritina AB1)]|nr:hypothetical protein ACH42_11280 [Endozoicomonas sp. (ex Bugula neritina AB1)]